MLNVKARAVVRNTWGAVVLNPDVDVVVDVYRSSSIVVGEEDVQHTGDFGSSSSMRNKPSSNARLGSNSAALRKLL